MPSLTKLFTKTPKKDLATLNDLFLIQMKDLYDTEKQIAQALPKMIKKTTSKELEKMLSHHLQETKDQIERLEKVYELVDTRPKRQTSLGMKGLIDDAKEVMSMKAEPELMDAAITANSQHIEHHEIAGYKATIEWAKLLGLKQAVTLLSKNLEQEVAMDKKLTALAKSSVNKEAAKK